MKDMFAQGGKGSAGIQTNKQAIARKFGTKQSYVAYFSAGLPIGGLYEVIYDKVTQRAYSLPKLATGITAVSISETGVLTHSAGSVDLGELAVSRWEFNVLNGTFTTGQTVNTRNDVLSYNGELYRWKGTLPLTVAPNSTPDSDDWEPVTWKALSDKLASVVGAENVGIGPAGTVADMLQFVRPWQFGAIADGTPHPLSERFATLAEAQAAYSFVTALTQTIDWAACQAADNYARAHGLAVRCIAELGAGKSTFHFGSSDYLKLGISSKWYGSDNVNRDTVGVTMVRTKPSVKPAFGQDAVVRVMDSTEASSPDEFVRGIVFDGFVLTRGVARRAASKADQTICFHANYGMGMKLGLVAFGAEYGVLGYSFWASTGWLKIDSCHKAFMADASLLTPEHPTAPSGSVNTTFNFDIRIDACVYGLVLKRLKYASFRGYIEGIAIGTVDVPFPIYDSANETAIAVTAINCDSVNIEQLGIEYWQGAILYNSGSTVTMDVSLTQDKQISNATGKQSAWASMAALMGTADPHPLPATANSVFYAMGSGSTVIRNITGDYSNAVTFSDVYFLTKEANASITFINCAFYFGANTTRFCNGSLARVDTVGGRYIEDVITPNGYTKVGKNLFVRTAWQTKAINGGDGRVQLAVGTETPVGLKFQTIDANVVGTATTSLMVLGKVSSNDTTIIYQTNVNAAGSSLQYKDTVSWTP